MGRDCKIVISVIEYINSKWVETGNIHLQRVETVKECIGRKRG